MKTNNKHILLPTDFSDNSWSAIVYTLKLYANENCTFYILNSAYPSVSSISDKYSKVFKDTEEKAKKDLLEIRALAEATDANANHEFQVILSLENLNWAIEKAIDKHKIDLVALGTKGATGAKEFFFGSNTVRIIKKIRSCPVLIIPEDYDFVTPKQIAFPTDFNRLYGAEELKPLKYLASLFNSKIQIVHINKEDELDSVQKRNLSLLKSHLDTFKHSLHLVSHYSNKATEIKKFIEELDIDILVMVNYEHSVIEQIFNEPVIKKIGFNPTIPFLVIPG
ncbi:universal stress protein [Jejuia pallidilutea]|uniref:Putative universal stress protein UspA n=1 Tax=Jejuia pallidilutea TaxID=504487 RepID=A0A090WE48_9FLAO|nr:universal stress protein [Jejuia pallidilutea]GAL65802.1 putative universal stress protein UspA [Jejuia pallidilutea]GAL88546.1 putative universal stress protein UspA [Jejuia pallidilutea]